MAGVGALYVHLPFCPRRCAYCDFATAAVSPVDPLIAPYVGAVASLLDEAAATGAISDVRTAYLGGGTPTFVGASLLGRLVGVVRAHSPALRELTVEANPDSLTPDVIAALVASGATRVSLGVQSLDDRELAELGRVHDGAAARRALGHAVESHLDVSADVMCATPRQTDASLVRTLDGIVGAGVGHVSVYPLAIEEGTPLACRQDVVAGRAAWNDADVAAGRMTLAARVLGEAGLARYEVASYARPGARCEHNVAYWTGVPYLGFGAAAASMLGADAYDALRSALAPQLPGRPAGASRARFVTATTTAELAGGARWRDLRFEVEFLDARQSAAEDLMLGMRMVDGVGEGLIMRARREAGEALDEAVSCVIGRGLARRLDGRLVPTEAGWLLGNELYGELWDLAGAPVIEAAC